MLSMQRLIKVVALVLILTNFASVRAEEAKQRTVTVTGKSSVKLNPDKASLRFAIINLEDKAEKAREKSEVTAKRVLNSVRALGVEEKLMQLESMQIQEEKKYNSKTRTYDFEGYKATRSFVVELHNLDLLADVIAAVVSNGSNELSNVEYGLQDPETAKKAALKDAMVNALAKADLILEPTKSKRGNLIEANELSNNLVGISHRGLASTRMLAMAAADPIAEQDSYAQGQIEIESSVRAVFEILD